MSIRLIQGDLLESDCDVIAHGCNCFCNMGAGIARQIQQRYPEALQADQETDVGEEEKMGTFTVGESESRLVYNLYTQYSYGRDRVHLDLLALHESLARFRADLITRGIYETSVLGLPLIGCGLAGGTWDQVRPVIERAIPDQIVHVYYLNDADLTRVFSPSTLSDRQIARRFLGEFPGD